MWSEQKWSFHIPKDSYHQICYRYASSGLFVSREKVCFQAIYNNLLLDSKLWICVPLIYHSYKKWISSISIILQNFLTHFCMIFFVVFQLMCNYITKQSVIFFLPDCKKRKIPLNFDSPLYIIKSQNISNLGNREFLSSFYWKHNYLDSITHSVLLDVTNCILSLS